jgi:archaellum component FlaC
MSLVYGKDNKSYWYTGLTSVGNDESSVGFVLVDTRTKETTFYKQSGATEYAAQSSAEGKVQEKGYRASLPIPYNINNIPTYVMTLKDDGGLVKMYAMVAINDYTIVGVGNSMRETLTSFKSVYNMAGNKINPTSSDTKKQIRSIVTRIQSDVKNGNSFYYFKVKDYPNIFVGSSQVSSEIPISVVGDSVKVSFDLDTEKIIDVTNFENLSLKK